MIKGYRDLEVWNRAHKLVLSVYGVTWRVSQRERFGVVSQLRRAACSVPANIAEGFGRRHTKELLQALAVANGSLEELHYFLLLSKDLNYLSEGTHEALERDARAIAQMLAALARSLKARAESRSQLLARNTEHESRKTPG